MARVQRIYYTTVETCVLRGKRHFRRMQLHFLSTTINVVLAKYIQILSFIILKTVIPIRGAVMDIVSDKITLTALSWPARLGVKLWIVDGPDTLPQIGIVTCSLCSQQVPERAPHQPC